MHAFAVGSFGEVPAINNLPIPRPDSALLIRVGYAGVNPIDYKHLERLTATSIYPFVMGIDFAGVVERVPTGERELRTGDRIFGMARTHGAYAEYTAVAPGGDGRDRRSRRIRGADRALPRRARHRDGPRRPRGSSPPRCRRSLRQQSRRRN